MKRASIERDGSPISNVVALRARRAEAAELHVGGTIMVMMSCGVFAIASAYLVIEASTTLAVLDRVHAIAYLETAAETQSIDR